MLPINVTSWGLLIDDMPALPSLLRSGVNNGIYNTDDIHKARAKGMTLPRRWYVKIVTLNITILEQGAGNDRRHPPLPGRGEEVEGGREMIIISSFLAGMLCGMWIVEGIYRHFRNKEERELRRLRDAVRRGNP